MSNKAIFGMTIFSLFLIFISLYLIKTLDPGQKAKPVTTTIINMNPENTLINKDFALIDENGQKFDYSRLAGKYTLLYFGFSYCPDICPITVQKLSEVSSLLDPNLQDKTQFIFVSVDPERDDNSALKKFTEQFDHKILGLTGDKSEIDKLASSLKVYYSADQKKENGSYYVDHSSFIYLLSPDMKLICQFTHDASAAEIFEQLKKVINNKEN